MNLERTSGACGRRRQNSRALLLRLMPLAASLFLAACASATAGGAPSGLRIASEKSVGDCQYVTDVHGVSGAYGVFAGAGLKAARSEAMQAALAAGANTVVWRSTSTTYGQTSIHGDAYECGK